MADDKGWSGMRVKGIKNQNVREFLAEAFGTFILVLFATATGCQLTLSGGQLSSFLSVNLAGGIGVAMALYACANVSGGAVNPAVTLAFCLTNRTPWRRLPVHWLGQLLGAFTAAAVTFGIYKDAIDHFDGGDRQDFGPNGTAGLFTSFPQSFVTTTTGFFDQIVGGGMLIIGILTIIDPRNMAPHKGLAPLLSGLLVTAIGGAFGLNCGYPINPARDLGPRLFVLAAGWSSEVFSYRDYNWFWVPILGPLAGSIVGTALYYLFVAFHWPLEEPEDWSVDDPTEKADVTLTPKDTHGSNPSYKINAIDIPSNNQHAYKNTAFARDTHSNETKF